MSDARCGLVVLPDAFQLGLGDDVLRWLRARVPVLGTRWIAPFDRVNVEMLYPGTGEWNAGWEVKLALLGWGPSMLVEVAAESWPALLPLKGPSSPWVAAPGTLRGDLDALGTALALVHAADTVDAAQADLRRLGARRAAGWTRSLGIGARSFPAALAFALAGLGAASERVLLTSGVARGPARLAALQQALDAVAREEPGGGLADWRSWGPHTAAEVRAHLAARSTQLDPWSDLVLTAGVHFFHTERRHAPT
jgi:hypothetical protein